jgi:hypothetical protein
MGFGPESLWDSEKRTMPPPVIVAYSAENSEAPVFRAKVLWPGGFLDYLTIMDEPATNSPKRRYRWPWVALIVFIIWVLLAVLWMSVAVRHVEEERSMSAPPTGVSH